MKPRLTVLHRRSRTSPEGKHAWAFGARAGYWPCLHAPFICIEFATHRIDIWYGDPSIETEGVYK